MWRPTDKSEYSRWPYAQLSSSDEEQKALETEQIMCCVAYIDILGFKEMILNNSGLPVLALRLLKVFRNTFFTDANRNNPDVEKLEDDDDDIDAADKPTATMFSDSIVISQPLDDYFHFPFFVETIANIQYELFFYGILTRGGISLGKLYHKGSFLFGEGLINAYLLESSRADYPRILVEQKLISHIQEAANIKFERSWTEYVNFEGERFNLPGISEDNSDYSEFLSTDFDDETYINYFLKVFEYDMFNMSEWYDIEYSLSVLEDRISGVILEVKDIIEKGLKTKNHKVLSKYEWLRKLYNKSVRIVLQKMSVRYLNNDSVNSFYQKWHNKLLILQ